MIDSYFQNFDNITFSQLWSTNESFIKDYKETGFPQQIDENNSYLTDDDLKLIWLLLIGRFADSTIKPYNTYGAFKVRFMSRVWQHGPSWKKKLDIQNKLRSMSLDDDSPIYEGARAIYNSALNPGTEPTSEELPYINSQNTTKYKKSKLEGIAILSDLLKNDVTEQFLRRFDDLFKTVIFSGRTLRYEGDISNNDI